MLEYLKFWLYWLCGAVSRKTGTIINKHAAVLDHNTLDAAS